MSRPSIVVLLNPRRPAAVIRLVVAAVVSAIKCMGWRRPRAHVCEKGSEVMQPPLADTNPSASVVLEVTRFRIRASFLHMIPRGVLGRALKFAVAVASCMTMTEVALASSLPTTTAARTTATATQGADAHDAGHSAIAQAFPVDRMLSASLNSHLMNANCGQATEFLSGEIKGLLHGPFYHFGGVIVMYFVGRAHGG